MSGEKFFPGAHVHCPHCSRAVRLLSVNTRDKEYSNALPCNSGCVLAEQVVIHAAICPACERVIVELEIAKKFRLIVPAVGARRPIHGGVPSSLKDDYEEAVLVLSDSPKSSAALTRRCLQSLLVHQGAKKHDLVDQLTEIYPQLPSYVQGFVDNIRKLGNLAVHAKQSAATGEIVDVEPGEAEWMLETLEELFDHFYAKPAEAKARQAALAVKFADAKKLKPSASQAGGNP